MMYEETSMVVLSNTEKREEYKKMFDLGSSGHFLI